MTSFYLCPVEDRSILVETSARVSARFLAGMGEPITVNHLIVWKQNAICLIPHDVMPPVPTNQQCPATHNAYLSLVDSTSDDVPLARSLPLIDAVICSDVPDAIRVDLTGGG